MKNLIIEALNEARKRLENKIPQIKRVTKEIDISEVEPLALPLFMGANNVPKEAFFDGSNNEYDGWEPGIVRLTWFVDVETTEEEKEAYRDRYFTTLAFSWVHATLINNGFKRVEVDTRHLKEFDGTSIYKRYTLKEFDTLVKYYSLYFEKI